ncbi:alpha-L-arabinofuranosidase C-terminal domain-containing protein [Sinomonas albida]|uniref:alpha-L-arabinofuranosidase C-terminal domain-containing protein n=1 Tax=Sinomonas albida TaxID=369942 RepID=UPI001B3C4FAA|nr:alpha-L-arabinofuranosidase C-terminal domain-containing protein [Sinomonas albida]
MNQTPMASMEIDPQRRQIEYSRHIFGQFIEHFHRQIYGGIFDPGSHLSDERGFRLDVLEALRELKIPNMRWPGGCFVSAYHWLDGVGPDRSPVYDPAWRVVDPNTFGTDEFVEWCRELGTDPYICTNAGTGTPEEMASWLEYTNREKGSKWSNLRAENGYSEPFAVPFWSIGNENYGDWEIGAKSAAEWASLVTESAKLMRRIDSEVKLLAAAVEKPDWAIPLLEQAGRYLDYISIHGYWDKLAYSNKPSSYMECMGLTLGPEKQIAMARALIEASGQRHVKIAFDEWNLRGWHHPWGNDEAAIAARDLNDNNATYTMADAVFSATFLNSCLRNGDIVGMANLAPTINTRGPLFVHPEGVVKRTTFHVMSMYANLLGPRVVDSAISSSSLGTPAGDVPLVDAIATTDETGRIKVALVNKSEVEAVQIRIGMGGKPIDGTRTAVILSGPHADAFNDVESPESVKPEPVELLFSDGVTTLPPHSVSICEIGEFKANDDVYEWSTAMGVWTADPTR